MNRTKRHVHSSPLKHYRMPESQQPQRGKARKGRVSKHAGQRRGQCGAKAR